MIEINIDEECDQTREITLGFYFLENVDGLESIQASSPSSIWNASLTVPNPTFLDKVPWCLCLSPNKN